MPASRLPFSCPWPSKPHTPRLREVMTLDDHAFRMSFMPRPILVFPSIPSTPCHPQSPHSSPPYLIASLLHHINMTSQYITISCSYIPQSISFNPQHFVSINTTQLILFDGVVFTSEMKLVQRKFRREVHTG